ncbi:MAG: ADP-ribosylation factor-like protein [Planctomycetota bacterium]
MSIVNTREKSINTKVVYYGTGLGGKTTSLQYVHSVLDPSESIKMVSLKTDEERTLFFDFLPIDLGELEGYTVKIQGFTVPGQVKYNLTRKYVLMGADGVVFVADSDPTRLEENIQSMANLQENLRANGLDPQTIPIAIQFNKRDLKTTTSVADLKEALCFREMPCYETSATLGTGVFEAFVDVSEAVLRCTAERYQLTCPNGDIGDLVRKNLESFASPS